jgi:hypothetical protein
VEESDRNAQNGGDLDGFEIRGTYDTNAMEYTCKSDTSNCRK